MNTHHLVKATGAEGATFRDGQYLVDFGDGYRPATPEELTAAEAVEAEELRIEQERRRADALTLIPALERIADTVLRSAVVAETMTPEAMRDVAVLFRRYEVGRAYAAGDVFEYEGALIEVRSAHTSQADWVPSTTDSLYKPHYPAGVIPFWVMPTGGHDAPNIGDERRHSDTCWRSLIDGNTTEPGSDPRWWEEFTCP